MKKNVIFFIALSTLASGINYLTYPLLGRILPESQYVNITVSLSLLTQITTFLSSIIAITIGISKSEPHGSAHEKITILQTILYKLFIAITLGFIVVSPILMQRIDVPLLFVIPICLMMIVSIPIAIISGYLNGKARMLQLGILTAISAGLQCLIAVSVALATRNGILAMLSMAVAQLITVFAIYRLLANEKLPSIGKAILRPVKIEDRVYMRKLATYTLLASLAIMAINLIQICDLLIVKTLQNVDVKFYTDIYVVSRIVFFAGMILIWPFLSEIDTTGQHTNSRPFLKLLGYFFVIASGATLVLWVFGAQITQLLFGVSYSIESIRHIGALSILYKFLFLIITAAVLYFIVLRNYVAVWLSGITTILIVAYQLLVPNSATISSVLTMLNIVAGICTILCIYLVFKHRRLKP